MCGIVGIVGREAVAQRLFDGLKRLEYRGYDSAGICTVQGHEFERRRAEGKLENLARELAAEPLHGDVGIAHTRWATHGAPTVGNAHPHIAGPVALVHNGIIENFKPLRDELIADGRTFLSETDSEVVAHLVAREVERGSSPTEAVATVLPRLHCAFAIAFLFKDYPDQIIGARMGAPLTVGYGKVARPDFDFDLSTVNRVTIVACGTSFYAGMVAKYWFEQFARVPVDIDVASEFRYRQPVLEPGGLALFISQSGETADTLAALRHARSEQQRIAVVVNVPTSSMAREADLLLPTHAGPEIGVASTKAFTCQLAVLAALAANLARAKGRLSRDEEKEIVAHLQEAPAALNAALGHDEEIAAMAHLVAPARDVLYLGRGPDYPMALEGALKLKEISYIHAEGYAAGEMKHGPIALIDEDVPVIVIAPSGPLFEKTVSNMQEVQARGGRVVLISDYDGVQAAGDN